MKRVLLIVPVFFATLAPAQAPAGRARHAPKAVAARTASAPAAAYLQPVHAVVEAINGRQEFPSQLFTDDVSIVDDFPPFAWQGREGAKAWYGSLLASETTSQSDMRITAGTPVIAPKVQAGLAYVTLPLTASWTEKGKKHSVSGPWTLVLQQAGSQWVIAAASFGASRETP